VFACDVDDYRLSVEALQEPVMDESLADLAHAEVTVIDPPGLARFQIT
jgi:hypothetical protein